MLGLCDPGGKESGLGYRYFWRRVGPARGGARRRRLLGRLMKRVISFIDPFVVFLVGTVVLASLLPARNGVADAFGIVTDIAIGLLFFLNGAKLSRQAIIAGIGHWRMHLIVLSSTFVLFPILGLSMRWIAAPFAHETILAGVVFLCLLPSTVQSSIAFTAMGGGNVPAAICSATLSNVLGVFITPVLVSLFLNVHGDLGAAAGAGGAASAVKSILIQLLAPFIVGHLCRPLLGRLLDRHKKIVGIVDRGSILMVVYGACSAAVVEGLWQKLSGADMIAVFTINTVILTLVVLAMISGGKLFGFSRADRISVVFCGSKKSLVSGVPMAGVLFPAPMVGAIILPLMLFHQMQLMLCAVLARRYAAQNERIAAALAKLDQAAAAKDA
jgi:sodium/bile acid cotransporter 7